MPGRLEDVKVLIVDDDRDVLESMDAAFQAEGAATQLATDGNEAVRRLAVVALKNGSARPDTIQILGSLGADDEQPRELREAAAKVAQLLRRKSTK